MKIMGIDPGLRVTGIGIIEGEVDSCGVVYLGMVKSCKSNPFPKRLHAIYSELDQIIALYHPDCVVLENSFYHRNVKTAFSLGQVRGVAIIAAACHGIPVTEYAPREVKLAVVGHGNASKEQVQYMVKTILELDSDTPPFDITDALAVALCHINRRRFTGDVP